MTTTQGELLGGRWRLGDRLGRGSFADVYEGTDDGTGERVAVKLLRHADDDQRARFAREVSALEALDHPGIISVDGHGELDGRPYLVLECVDGGTLAGELSASGALPPERVATIGAALAAALDHAHRRGVVHRYVKPSNVLLDGDARPLLADFGVAMLDGTSSLTASGLTIGTAAYLAPEQVRGDVVGPAADVYALGLLLLEAATGERAYPGSGVATAMARLDSPPPIPPSLPAPLAERIRAMTAMRPGDRPPAAAVATEAPRALAGAVDDDGTAVLPVVDDDTQEVAVVGPATVAMAPVVDAGAEPASGDAVVPPVEDSMWRRLGFALVCFAAGFLLVLAVRGLAGAGGDDVEPQAPATVPVTVATTPTTPVPTTEPPPPPDDDRGNGRGNDNGRGRDRDD